MPSRAAYTAFDVSRSDTGCSTILIPWVEELLMVTPEVVGHTARRDCRNCRVGGEQEALKSATDRSGCGFVPHQEYADTEPEEASRFLTGLVTCFATHGGIPAVAAAATRR